MNYSPQEMMAIAAAREIRNEDIVFCGTGVSMVAAMPAKHNISVPRSIIFINRYLSEKIRESEGKDYLNSKQLYAPFRSCKLVTFLETLAGSTKKDIIPLSEDQRAILHGIVSESSVKFKPIYSLPKTL